MAIVLGGGCVKFNRAVVSGLNQFWVGSSHISLLTVAPMLLPIVHRNELVLASYCYCYCIIQSMMLLLDWRVEMFIVKRICLAFCLQWPKFSTISVMLVTIP
jgi:hypothetical protein